MMEYLPQNTDLSKPGDKTEDRKLEDPEPDLKTELELVM